ncbi:STT3 domain-containing protein [Sulfurospirillum barnesii]|uniref:Putative membrane protein, required for N-linked glycosylation n=1 Tax=Sulfurospirillum barnesii (strain ATCC 700032 / DSM 10660 / SES-3) TaxID=760154 RepID=I3XYV9_SULBS|nr:STT3 domain-containing protein [Sulfurospirillum barnesii]AFL69133.1 putative membrane protein, required for N-linked glycosylation [Sulfurospirillum barnesii SES-3]
MHKMSRFSYLNLFIFSSIAFLFSFVVRLIWVYQFNDYEAFTFAGQFMINTNDGYYWAEGARDLLSSISQKYDLSPIDSAPAWLTYVAVKLLPFSFESIIFYMPAILGSLIVIPLILIAHNLKMIEVGFLAALLGSIAVSYYNRTMVGYYDTDMLTIVFPTFLVWSLILAFRTQEEKYLIITAIEIIAYRWWYPQSYSLEFAFFGLILLYMLIFQRKNIFYYQLLAIMLFAMMGLDALIRSGIVMGVYWLFKQEKFQKYTYGILAVAIALFFLSGGFEPIWVQLKGYVFKDAIEVADAELSLHFFSVMQTIREAGQIPFSVFAERISGHTVTFILSLVGYGLLLKRYPVMFLALPLLGLGFLALWGGLRFTIYAVPVCALGVAYLLFTCSEFIMTSFVNDRVGSIVKSSFVILASLGILYPNLLHVMNYRVPTVFNQTEVAQLDMLKSQVQREDYIVTWWDYGYPLRYYSDVKTLIDGGKHSGEVNFPVSFMLTNSMESAARLARLEVEYTEKAFSLEESNTKKSKKEKVKLVNNTAKMTLDYGFRDANDFLDALQTPLVLPEKTRDIYFYLPYRMIHIFPTVAQFSNIDVMSGKTAKEPFFFESSRFKDEGALLHFGNGIVFDKAKGTLKIGAQEVMVKQFIQTSYTPEMKFSKVHNTLHVNGVFSIIYMQAYNTFLIVDEAMLNSLYIQMFVLENYDERFFEPISLEAYAKVYKLKI